MRNQSILAALILLTAGASPALARPGGWGGPGWGGGSEWGGGGYDRGWGSSRSSSRGVERDRSGEGRIEVNRFVAEGDAAQALGHGSIAVADSQTQGQDYVPQENRAAYEAAIVDQLVHAGYDTAQARPEGGQLAELTVTRTVLQPAEAPHSPVSGSAAMSVGTGGSAYGLAVNVDLTKPLPPLVSTRLQARIRDRATNAILWEGRAQVATREGDEKWGEQAIATRLAKALFDGFPRANDAPVSLGS